jgi:hypothetical protein
MDRRADGRVKVSDLQVTGKSGSGDPARHCAVEDGSAVHNERQRRTLENRGDGLQLSGIAGNEVKFEIG